MKSDGQNRDALVRVAKVHLTECRARRRSHVNRDFYWRLFAWAQNARRRAMASREPMQGGLFGA